MIPDRNAQATLVRPLPRPDASRRLICLSFCGGGAAAYKSWASRVDDDVELVIVCYPGREGRFAERFAVSWDELAADACRSVALGADRPYTLFGHSMGGWMAFDVVTRMARLRARLPELLVVSSCNSPDRGLTARDMFPRLDDTDETLIAWMRKSGMLPDHVLGDADLTEMALDLLRADIRVRDTFALPHGTATDVPIQVLHGAADDVIEADVAAHWRRVARAGFRSDELPGGHFYNPAVWADLPAYFATPTTVTAAPAQEGLLG
ncbi:alpha/beta fold hydrolase [Actinoplanes sp. NPDC049548]|uniref:thioesterase II family protein n=1 Tax=Actinoplanes sp. NPDC049548 TaxID=3155152 RepID=UPI0034154ED8